VVIMEVALSWSAIAVTVCLPISDWLYG
jgi:hypothetical protein